MKKGLVSRFRNALISGLVSLTAYSQEPRVVINEIVCDPQIDRTLDGKITGSDEFFELYNLGEEEINLEGWKLELNDKTPENKNLEGRINPKSYFVITNPRGEQNNNGEIRLINEIGELVDSFSYGTFSDGAITNANSSGEFDEALARYPDGGTNWVKTFASPGSQNIYRTNNLMIFIARTGDRIKVYSTNIFNHKLVLQEANSAFKWENILTNSHETIEYETNPNDNARFYRLLEINND